MAQYVLIEMNDYSYPDHVSVYDSHDEALRNARALIRMRGQTETMIEENKDWISDRFSHIPTRGTETRDAYIIMKTE